MKKAGNQRAAFNQIAELLMRDSEGRPQDFFSNLEKTSDGRLSFIVGRRDTGEYYRHTVETVLLSEEQLQSVWSESTDRESVDPNAVGFYELCGHSGTVAEIGNSTRCTDCRKSVDERFDEFWRMIVYRKGVLDIEEVKGNLLDFSMLIENAKAVYMHITAGNIGNLNTDASAVIAEADRQVQKQIDEAVEEALDELSHVSAEPGFKSPIALVIDRASDD